MMSLTSSTPVYLAHSTCLLKYSSACFDGIQSLWIGFLVPTTFSQFLLSSLTFYLLPILLLRSNSMLYPPQSYSTFRTRSREIMVVCIAHPALDFSQFISSRVFGIVTIRTEESYFCLPKQKMNGSRKPRAQGTVCPALRRLLSPSRKYPMYAPLFR